MMTLKEAIRHVESKAKTCEWLANNQKIEAVADCERKCGEEHRQLADWLKELQRYQWIPCSERLPEERQDVYVTVFWDDYGDTITAYGMRTKFGWLLWNTAEAELIKGYTVIVWMPLPEPWKGADDE